MIPQYCDVSGVDELFEMRQKECQNEDAEPKTGLRRYACNNDK